MVLKWGDANEGKDKETEEEYDPYTSRELKNATNDFESMVHIVKGILGTGILALPEAFKNAGIVLGFVFSGLNAALNTYGIHIFINCVYILCKRNRINNLTYTEAMRLGFEQGPPWAQKMSKAASLITDIVILFYQIGICCVYVLFVVVNVKSVCDVYAKENISVQAYLVLLVLPILFINSLRNLKILAPFSLVANLVTFLVIAVVFYYIFREPLPHFSERKLFRSLRRFPLFFGTTSFAFTSVAVSVAVYNNMKHPNHFSGWFGVYNRGLVILLCIYIPMGFFGYWRFGENTEPSITLNLPSTAILTQVVNSLYAVAIYISYGLNGYVPIQLLLDTYLMKRLTGSNWPIIWEYLLRFTMVTVTMFFAASIPMLGLFMSVFGAIALSHMSFIFPSLLDICVRYPDKYGRKKFYMVRDILLICYGMTGLLTGCYVGIQEIILEFIKQSKK